MPLSESELKQNKEQLPASETESENGTKPASENPPTPEEEAERGFLPVLKNRNFLTLWSGQVFSQLADKIYLVLTIGIVANSFVEEGQSISIWVSAITIAFTIPAVLFGAAAGVYVDRWLKKSVLVSTNLLRGVLVLALPLVLWASSGQQLGQLPLGFCLMLVVTFLVSTLTQFFAPAEQSVIPLIVERRHLLSANSLYTTTMMASVIIGFAVGDPVLELADAAALSLGVPESIGKELVVGGSYAIAGLLLILLRTGEKKDANPHEQPHVLADLRDGLRYLRKQRRVRNAMVQLIVLFSIFAALAVLAVPLAEKLPTLEAEEFGYLLAAAGVGMAIGAGIVSQAERWLSNFQMSTIGSAGMAGALIGLSLFNRELWLVVGLIALLGLFGALVGVPMQTTIQAETPEEMRGKVFGLQNNAVNIALSLPLALAGVAETFLGLPVVLLALACFALAGGVLTWYISSKSSDR